MNLVSHSRRPTRRRLADYPLKRLLLAMALAAGSAQLALAGELPQIQNVVQGAVNISQDGSSMQIQTQTGRTAIDWKNFSIGADNKVHFQQPDGSSITLNRVTGASPSAIYGMLTSNGKLILLNPNGIWFGPNSRVSTASLVAGAGRVTDEQIERFRQTGKLDIDLTGKVANHGQMVMSGENAVVALLGAEVENTGLIRAQKGRATLASGPQATIDFSGDGLISLAGDPHGDVKDDLRGGVHNSGVIDVGGGSVVMSAARAARHLDSVISLGGAVVADSVSEQGGSIVLGNAEQTRVTGSLSARGNEGGSIKVLGDNVSIADGARLDASGTGGKGGSLLVGGGFRGQGSEQRAQNTAVEKGAQLRADGATDGGTIVAWSDGRTHFAGQASARGGQRGGVVETSGKQLQVTADAKVDTGGSQRAGTWLLDPQTVTIDEAGGADAVAASTIVEALKTGNVEISASERINVNAPIIARQVWQTVDAQGNPTGGTLALIAAGNPTQGRGYVDANGNRADLHDDGGSVYINAPILLAGGNLFIAATGDVRLVNNTPGQSGDAAMMARAIIDVGDGIVWIKTSNVASVSQDAGTAIKAGQLAVEGASVLLDSDLNFAGTLAGKASNGVFRFSQTNASGTTSTGTVNSPYSSESLTGVTAQELRYVGSREVVADTGSGPGDLPLVFDLGGQSFDYLVFEATGFVGPDGQLLSPEVLLNYLDSSDYLVNGISFKVGNETWSFKPDASDANLTQFFIDGVPQGSLPLGFALDANGGLQVVSTLPGTTGWGVETYQYIPGAVNQAEVQHNVQDGSSQQLIISLGQKVDQVQVTLGWLMDDGIWNDPPVDPSGPTSSVLRERAIVHFLSTEQAPESVSLTARKATVEVGTQDASRTYGDANPGFTSSTRDNAAAAAAREVDSFVDRQLGQDRLALNTQVGTAATERSNVGQYAIQTSGSPGSHMSQRYDVSFGSATLTITPAPLRVVADDKAKQVGDADPALTYQASGWKFAEDARDFTLAREPGEAAGNYRIFEQDGTRLVSANYQVIFVDGNLRIDGPVAPEPGPEPKPEPGPTPEPTPEPPLPPSRQPVTSSGLNAGTTSERCTPIESPASIIASDTVSPAVVRSYSVQLVCKPRSYGTAEEQLPDRIDLINYANSLIDGDRFRLPDWNRGVIPHELELKAKEAK
ncbi:MBG domain-containing protein [Pseudomonas sp. 273]|uniref:two-partner secretion domain-containing protein n=1 Tax=Pseudomonas sp. 273 TaxID=75692 RepID=UPI0023D7CC2C|nr:MBG domain-containing protein [Pseudomonas sp. 273]